MFSQYSKDFHPDNRTVEALEKTLKSKHTAVKCPCCGGNRFLALEITLLHCIGVCADCGRVTADRQPTQDIADYNRFIEAVGHWWWYYLREFGGLPVAQHDGGAE